MTFWANLNPDATAKQILAAAGQLASCQLCHPERDLVVPLSMVLRLVLKVVLSVTMILTPLPARAS